MDKIICVSCIFELWAIYRRYLRYSDLRSFKIIEKDKILSRIPSKSCVNTTISIKLLCLINWMKGESVKTDLSFWVSWLMGLDWLRTIQLYFQRITVSIMNEIGDLHNILIHPKFRFSSLIFFINDRKEMKTRRSTSYPTRNVFPKAETSIYNRLFVIAKKLTCIIALSILYLVAHCMHH